MAGLLMALAGIGLIVVFECGVSRAISGLGKSTGWSDSDNVALQEWLEE